MAATIADAGLGWKGVWTFLTTRDPFQRTVIAATANEVLERREKSDESRANKIANAVGRMLSGKE
jgi:hypothetical protein